MHSCFDQDSLRVCFGRDGLRVCLGTGRGKTVGFNVLGTLEVTHKGHICTPTAMKVRWTLALLVCRANQIVGVEALIDELWGSRPPRSAVTTAQTYIYQLRKFFER